MSTMVERSEIPDHIWEAARSLRNAVLWESNSSVEHIAQALLAAEKRGKEEAAKIASNFAAGVGLKSNSATDKEFAVRFAAQETAALSIAAAIRGS